MIITRTPFRISFFGGGTDYPVWYLKRGGAVLSSTIDKYCYITCRYLPPFFEHKNRIVWSKIESVKDIKSIEHPAVRGILEWMGMQDGVEIHHDADLPARSGLGSSSSFAVGLLHALYALQGKMRTKRQLALDAIHIEQEVLKEYVGSQDQVAAAFGGLNKIEFGASHHIAVTPVTLPAGRLDYFQSHLMLFYTGLSRFASEIAAEQVKNTTRNEQELIRMGKMVSDAIAVLSGPEENFLDFGKLLHETWILKRGLALNVTNPVIDTMYRDAREAGAIGGKLLGAGGGGFMLFFVPPAKQGMVRERLKAFLRVPFRFEHLGSQLIYYGPTQTA